MSQAKRRRKVKEGVKSRRMCEEEFGLSFCIYRVLERWWLLILCALHGASLGAYMDKEIEKNQPPYLRSLSCLFLFLFLLRYEGGLPWGLER